MAEIHREIDMTSERFHLEAGHALVWDGRTIDLHNNFVFNCFNYSVKHDTASLSWSRSEGQWVTEDDPHFIKIVLTNVNFLRIESSLGTEPAVPTTLEYAGYLNAEDVEVMNGFLERTEVSGGYHIIFCFEGGMTIKIGASSGYITIGP
jgi:hypothetical protein